MILYVATAFFLTTFLLGLLVRFRVVDSSGFRWLRHALFFAVVVVEILALPLVFTLLNGVLLFVRIRAEEDALHAATSEQV